MNFMSFNLRRLSAKHESCHNAGNEAAAAAAGQLTSRSDATVASIIYRSDIAAGPGTWTSNDDANEVTRSDSAAC